MTPEQAIRESQAITVIDTQPDVKWFHEFVKNSKDDWRTIRLFVWLLRRSNNQSEEIARAAEAVANHAILREALENIAQPHGCGCTPICRCFAGDAGREIVESIQDTAKEALANVPPKAPRKAATIPQELTGIRVGSFTLAELPEGVKSPPTPPRLEGTPIPLMRDRQLVDAARSVLAECASRGLLIHGIDMPKFAKG